MCVYGNLLGLVKAAKLGVDTDIFKVKTTTTVFVTKLSLDGIEV
jgi:hypothetical protein